MRTFFLFIFYISFAGFMQAQNQSTELMDRMEKAFINQDVIAFDFTLTVEIPEQNDITLSGNLLRSGSKFSATMGERWIKTDGKTQWVYDPDLDEIQIFDASQDNSLPISPKELLKIYNKSDFDYDITGKNTIEGVLVNYVEFKPKEKIDEVVKVRIAIEENTAYPQYIKVFERDGTRYALKMDNIVSSPQVNGAEFTFNAAEYPDTNIEDLRIK